MSSPSKVPPPMGHYDFDPKRTCTRLVGYYEDGRDKPEKLCDAPAVVHVGWPNGQAGFVCAEHQGELETRWEFESVHDLGSACGMPGSAWMDAIWEDERKSWCYMPEDGADAVEPVRAVAQEVAR